ncbi:MAG: enolase C-terminal domain-like protein [Bdellovibrionota bacterium]
MRVPTDLPESDGTLVWNSTTLVLVELRAAGESGIGYTYADPGAARVIEEKLRELVLGSDAFSIDATHLAMRRAIRNLGSPGICAMAISAVDIALWDLKAKLLGCSLAQLLGQFRPGAPIYGSGGFTSYSVVQLQEQLSSWSEQGARAVKMKVGTDPDADPERVRAAREAIGQQCALFVDANGAYDAKLALALAREFSASDVRWFEEPVSSDDLAGLRLVREHAPPPMRIAAGEYGYDSRYFERMLAAQAVDVLQADATRCMGITGFLRAAAICDAHGMALSSHCAPALHAALGASLPVVAHLEYFHDHVRIEELIFEGTPRLSQGDLLVGTSPGLGLKLRRKELRRFAA